MTEDRIITYFVIIDDLLKELRLREEPQAVISNSEVLTMAVIAHIDFCANYSKALDWLKSFCSHLFPKVPDKSTFSRRLEKLLPYMQTIILKLASLSQVDERYYLIDSMPVKVCENARIWTCKTLKGELYRGYTPSKREYFYGLKLNALMDSKGLIREVHLLEGSRHDIDGLANMSFYSVESKEIICDKAYKNYLMEDILKEEGIVLNPLRSIKESRYEGEWIEYAKRLYRRLAESVFSVLKRFIGMRPYSVSLNGLLVKIYTAVVSYNLYRMWKMDLI